MGNEQETQTDEVKAALVNFDYAIFVIRDAGFVETADSLQPSISVLSAEIERLRRRVEELRATLRPFAQFGGGFLEPQDYASVAAITARGRTIMVGDLLAARAAVNGTTIETEMRSRRDQVPPALASAAAPDERVLAERERCELEVLRLRDSYSKGSTFWLILNAAAVTIRTPDQDTAP